MKESILGSKNLAIVFLLMFSVWRKKKQTNSVCDYLMPATFVMQHQALHYLYFQVGQTVSRPSKIALVEHTTPKERQPLATVGESTVSHFPTRKSLVANMRGKAAKADDDDDDEFAIEVCQHLCLPCGIFCAADVFFCLWCHWQLNTRSSLYFFSYQMCLICCWPGEPTPSACTHAHTCIDAHVHFFRFFVIDAFAHWCGFDCFQAFCTKNCYSLGLVCSSGKASLHLQGDKASLHLQGDNLLHGQFLYTVAVLHKLLFLSVVDLPSMQHTSTTTGGGKRACEGRWACCAAQWWPV